MAELASTAVRYSSSTPRKSCIHIAHPDGRIIPFDTYNLFYRDDLEATRLAPLRAQLDGMWT